MVMRVTVPAVRLTALVLAPLASVVDVDALHAMGLVRDWEIDHLPGLILTRDGEAWARVVARLQPDALAAAVRAARAGPPDPDL